MEQQNQLNQYASLITDYKKKGEYRLVGYYLYKSASVHLKAGEHQNAIDKYLQAAKYYEQIGSYTNKKKIYSNIAFVYAEMGRPKNAKKYYTKGLEISRRLNNRFDISASLMEVATMEIYIKDYTKAQSNLEEALKIGNALNDALLLRTCYRLLAQLYKAYGNKKKSDQYYDSFLIYDKHVKEEGTIRREDIADKTITAGNEERDILIEERKNQQLEFELSDLKNKWEQDSLNRAITAGADSLAKAEELTDIVRREKGLLEKENEYRKTNVKNLELEIDNKNLTIYGGIVGIILLVLLIISAIVAFLQKRRDNKQLEQQKIEIEIKSDQVKNKNDELEDAMEQIQYQNKNIMQSINYAQRIQEAMMPKQEMFQSHVPDSFIFFKPRDIVSGDFYWFMDTESERNGAKNLANSIENSNKTDIDDKNKKFIVSAVDCTGHGVPGAFMSMLGFNLLNDIVGKGTFEPNKILSQLHDGIRTSLNQDATQNRDGMDMALCVIDPEKKTLEYAGAQNPLIYIQDEKVYRVRGNKFPVGGFQVEHHDYTKHTIKLDKPTTCYVFTDGYHDQFGGPQGRKFMTKSFRELLFEIHNMPMEEQKNILDLVINEWMGENEQTDDILIIGFSLDFSGQNQNSEMPEEDLTEMNEKTKNKKTAKKDLTHEELPTRKVDLVKENIVIAELKTKNELEKERADKNEQPVSKLTTNDKPSKNELKTENEKIIENADAVKELLFGKNKTEEEDLSVKKERLRKKKSIKQNTSKDDETVKNRENEIKPVKKDLHAKIVKDKTEVEKDNLTVEKPQIETKKAVEEKLSSKDIQTENKKTDKQISSEKLETGNQKPEKEIFTIKKLKKGGRKPQDEIVKDEKSLTEKKIIKPIKKTNAKTEISDNSIITIRKL